MLLRDGGDAMLMYTTPDEGVEGLMGDFREVCAPLLIPMVSSDQHYRWQRTVHLRRLTLELSRPAKRVRFE
ncbi:hypothetical protein LIMNO130_50577 [Limnobacter sp. 130]|nr:hypothetical protein LIMNO130_50577 [Limnobacter sp. 130]